MKKFLPLCILLPFLLQACHNKPDTNRQTQAKQDSVAKSAQGSPYKPVNSWIDDFRNFRTAVFQNDVEKQKTYFSFPLNTESTQIWELVYESADKRPESFPATFTEGDFLKHRSAIFNNAFTKSILKVKSDSIARKDGYTTPQLKFGKDTFFMIANYDKENSTLQLTVSYPGGTDEQGNYVSEGEYAVIYFFKIEGKKYLKFDKVLFAG